MKKFHALFFAILLFTVSCKKEPGGQPGENEQTVFFYLPWSGDLTNAFRQNIEEFRAAIAKNILRNERVVVFFCTSPSEATLFELKYYKGECISETLKEYTDPAFTTREGIASILKDVKRYAPAPRYGMIIGCHGMGWIPVDATRAMAKETVEKEYWEYEGVPKTRWFGGTSTVHRTEISTLAGGIADAGIKMEYIMFDDCYMSTIEVAYELKDVTDYLIASPNEIMQRGMPYDTMAGYLIGKVDYKNLCQTFHDFYSVYELMPCGTIAVTVCGELDRLASVMKEINTGHTLDPSLLGTIQVMDGYNPTRFFDLRDYVRVLCTDTALLARFDEQLERTIPSDYRRHTEYFYTMSRGKIKINSFTGSDTSDPGTGSMTSAKTETAWYKATH